ncbi:hypothetical protein GCM10011531_10150 [Aquaticitalea lipolytica]|uniref:Secretion system C-terminal sorting domain-containing protein n=2 Tax=Aquaticitalea lipolytica TaxID=1247562 RepID=A0A8J2TNK0_9FLAO|nr:hypothetical protein GCM10011531_10150 [Aquaticitalea lipolytica]
MLLMKKLLLLSFILAGFVSLAQETQYYTALPNNGSTSGLSRAPQGTQRYIRTVYLITSAEATASGLVNGDVINSIGFLYSTAQNLATTGNFIVYMQNTADATNTKSTTWSTAISGMTTVSNSTFTIPATTGQAFHTFSGGSPFTYTGGAIYVAFDYQNAAGPIATTANVALCSNTLTAGLKNAQSTTAIPTTLTSTSNFRPHTLLGKNVACASPLNIATSNITLTGADVTWTGAGTNYSIQYGTQGFTVGNGTIVNNISSPYTIPSLNSGTAYSYYIKKFCTAPNESIWDGPYNFTTVFAPATPPYSYGFEANGDWSILNAGTGNNWGLYTATGTGAIPAAAEGTAYAAYPFNSTNAANAWLFSRALNLTAGTSYNVDFKYRTADGTPYPENFKVTMGTDKTVAAQTNTLQTYNSTTVQVWTQANLTFTPSTTGVYYLGFHCFSAADQYVLAVDDVQITQTLSTEEFSQSRINVYPNPVKDILNIKSDIPNIESITITDLNGRIVKSINYNTVSEVNCNISDLNSGIYFLRIASTDGILDKKIIKN